MWSTAQTTPAISVSAAGIYTVIVTDAKGCQTSASIEVKTLNVQCGNSNDKVMICHNNQAICVSSSSVQAHLNHGDKLGSCTVANKEAVKSLITDGDTTEDVVVYPNPVTSILNVKVNEVYSGATLEVYNILGVKLRFQALTNTLQAISLEGLPSGNYLLYIFNGHNITVKNIIKE